MGTGKRVLMDIEAGHGVGSDFKTLADLALPEGSMKSQMDMYQRYLRTSTAASAQTAEAVRQTGKHAALGMAYGMGAVGVGTMIHDGQLTKAQFAQAKLENEAADNVDNDEDWRWAVAFRTVMGVGEMFYEKAPAQRKRFLEQAFTEVATHNSNRGRRAAKILQHRVTMVLDDRMRPQSDDLRFFSGQSWSGDPSKSATGRMVGGPSLQNIPKEPFKINRILGRTFDRIIIDEAATLKGVIDDPEGTPVEGARRVDPGLSLDGHDAPDQRSEHGDPQE